MNVSDLMLPALVGLIAEAPTPVDRLAVLNYTVGMLHAYVDLGVLSDDDGRAAEQHLTHEYSRLPESIVVDPPRLPFHARPDTAAPN